MKGLFRSGVTGIHTAGYREIFHLYQPEISVNLNQAGRLELYILKFPIDRQQHVVLSVFLTFQEFSLGFSVPYIEFMTTRILLGVLFHVSPLELNGKVV